MRAGIYIHTPFCRSRCSYCDFATGMFESDVADRYVRAVVAEISRWREVEPSAAVDTVYFGGGTPSLLTVEQLEHILNAVRGAARTPLACSMPEACVPTFDVAADAEITLEINPGDGGENADAQRKTMSEWRRLGINRASFGAQTFDDRELKMLGRTHDSGDISKTFQRLRDAGFDNINFDLIAALPGQTLEGWQRNLDEALQLRPEHLSLYLLDVHEGTPLHDQINRGMRPRPDEDLAAEMYALMIERVCAAGYEHYEISNFCLPGRESRHNTKYWSGAPYYGFGNSAHSYDGAHGRWANERDAAKYVELIEKDQSPIVERTELTEEDARSEAIFLGLRLLRGIDLNSYRARFGTDLREQFNGELDRLKAGGLVAIDEERLKLTTRGALLSNEVFAALA
ncbi:MAG TPA: radical SAM family heme chaperone HemW [Pyrinomonadaceae bacterium]|nr:radical SAM family heme chaperone HemW [Pyrinomonadaceae bacterium]